MPCASILHVHIEIAFYDPPPPPNKWKTISFTDNLVHPLKSYDKFQHLKGHYRHDQQGMELEC